jgi:hypothetical protein
MIWSILIRTCNRIQRVSVSISLQINCWLSLLWRIRFFIAWIWRMMWIRFMNLILLCCSMEISIRLKRILSSFLFFKISWRLRWMNTLSNKLNSFRKIRRKCSKICLFFELNRYKTSLIHSFIIQNYWTMISWILCNFLRKWGN